MNQKTTTRAAAALLVALNLLAVLAPRANAAFHLWQVKEVFTNADGSVQFIELFNSFGSEQFVVNHTLRANSDGVIKNFTIPGNVPNTPSTANTHMLIATPGFASLPGAVTPDFTLPAGLVPFFNPNAGNITITFTGSNDSMGFSGTLLPENGFNSLTDMNAFGTPGNATNTQVTANTPTRFPNTAGQIDLRAPSPTGDYNGNGVADAADYVIWRKWTDQFLPQLGCCGDGNVDGIVDQEDYDLWRMRFGSVSGPMVGSVAGVPEPTSVAILFGALATISVRPGRSNR